MGRGKWTRYGRFNAWGGWGLEIGWALRGNVSVDRDGHWQATVNSTDLEIWPTCEEAKKAVELHITRNVQAILEDWAIWQRELAAATRSEKKETP